MASDTTAGEGQHPSVAEINARIDRLPRFPLPVGTLVLMAILYFFSYYDITVIGDALPAIADEFHLNTAQLGLPVTLNLAGYVVGAYTFGSLADYLGRRKTLLLTLAVLTVGALLTAFSWDIVSLSVFRLIVGIGTGAQISLAATYMAEVTPARLRGRFTQLNIIWAAVGLGGAPWVALPLVGIPNIGWRILLGLGAVAVIVAFLVHRLPESPRWLVVHDRPEAAEAVVTAMENRVRRSTPEELPSPAPAVAESHRQGFPTKALFHRPYLSRIILVLAFWIAWYIPTYAVLGYEPILLKNIGVSEPNSLLFTALGDIAFPIGALITWLLIDRLERKWIITAVMIVYTAAMVILALATGSGAIVAGAVLFALCILAGSGAGYIYTSEIFPTRARASAMSIGDGIGHIGGVVAPTVALGALAAWGGRGTFALLAGLAFAGLLLISIGGIATTGRSLTRLIVDNRNTAT
jgi:putative MFS transporter